MKIDLFSLLSQQRGQEQEWRERKNLFHTATKQNLDARDYLIWTSIDITFKYLYIKLSNTSLILNTKCNHFLLLAISFEI